jgi:dihydrofolate synthase/folylpolyglutamate synthase
VSGTLASQKVRVTTEERDYGTLPTALAASYQLENIATAVAAIEALGTHARLPVPDDAVARGLAEANWPGRFQLLQADPPTLVDGAHNPDGAAALVRALKDAKSVQNVALVCGFCADKDVDGFFRTVAPIAKRAWTVPIPNPRSMVPAAAAAIAARYRLAATPLDDAPTAIAAAREWARREEGGVVVVCGSLFLVGEVLARSK